MMGKGSKYAGHFTSLPRHDRNSRFETTAPEITNHFEGLNINPHVPDLDVRFFRHYDPRALLSPRVIELDRVSFPRNMENRLGSMAQRKDALPYGRAMRKLHQQLCNSEEFYINFRNEFDNEVKDCKKYTTSVILARIWQDRVEGNRDPKAVIEGERDDENYDIEEMKGKFVDNERELTHALSLVLASKFISVWEKVQLANDHIRQLLKKAANSREGCVMLLREMAHLKRLIDPEDEENKALFRRPKDGNDRESSDRRSTDGNAGWSEE